jgi:DNA-directed RNA polymerase specialized sigma24 family protein
MTSPAASAPVARPRLSRGRDGAPQPSRALRSGQSTEGLDRFGGIIEGLPERQRMDLAMKISGHSYVEIARAGGRSHTNVNNSLVKARRRIQAARQHTAGSAR